MMRKIILFLGLIIIIGSTAIAWNTNPTYDPFDVVWNYLANTSTSWVDGTGQVTTDVNVGIGTDSPGAKLDVNGYVKTDTGLAAPSLGLPTTIGIITIGGDSPFGGQSSIGVKLLTSKPFGNSDAGYIEIDRPNSAQSGHITIKPPNVQFGTPGNIIMDVAGTYTTGNIQLLGGNVGVGTTSPTEKLDVEGTVKATAFIGDGSGLTNISETSDTDWNISGNDMYSGVSGNVGIGIDSPGAKLDVNGYVKTGTGLAAPSLALHTSHGILTVGGNSPFAGQSFIGLKLLTSTPFGNSQYGYIQIDQPNAANSGHVTIKPPSVQFTTPGNVIIDVARTYTTGNIQLLGGNVGIGTNSPSHELNVVGDVNITGNLYAGSGSAVLFVDDTNDRVGIGTSSPGAELDVEGDVKSSGDLTVSGGDVLIEGSTPSLAGSHSTSSANDVFVSGKYAYVADHDAGLRIFDVSNPSSPSLLGSYDTSAYVAGVYVGGKYAYIADYFDGVKIIDVSNPSSPSLVGSYDTPGYAWHVYLSGKHLFVADYQEGLRIIDISNPSSPSLAGSYNTSGEAKDVYVSGEYAYVADAAGGLQIIDISNIGSPTFVANWSTLGSSPSGVYVRGEYAYIADGIGLKVIDVSNPSSPSLVGSYDTYSTLDTSRDIYVSGKYAYVAGDDSGLIVIDVSNPSSPSLVGSYDTSGSSWGVYVSGKYAYLADKNGGMQIIQVSGIDTPTVLTGNIETGDITVTENADVGNNLYVGNGLNVGPGGLYVDAGQGITTDGDLIALGNVGVGIKNPSAKLDVNGTGRFTDTLNTEGGLKLENSDSEPVTCDSANKGYTYFDTTDNVFKGCIGNKWVILGGYSDKIKSSSGSYNWADVETNWGTHGDGICGSGYHICLTLEAISILYAIEDTPNFLNEYHWTAGASNFNIDDVNQRSLLYYNTGLSSNTQCNSGYRWVVFRSSSVGFSTFAPFCISTSFSYRVACCKD